VAEAITELGSATSSGFSTFHVANPHDDGIGLDQYVDWLVETGHPIERIPDYEAWLSRFETTLRALPERQRQASLLPLLHAYRHPTPPFRGSLVTADRFHAAVKAAGLGSDGDIPRISAATIQRYVDDLRLDGLLP
jgi:fatty acid CoA ligase FadD9